MKKNKKGIDSWGYWKEFATQAQLSTFFFSPQFSRHSLQNQRSSSQHSKIKHSLGKLGRAHLNSSSLSYDFPSTGSSNASFLFLFLN
jgi:hypothetical protein